MSDTADPPASTPEPAQRARLAVTLEQCWHRVPGGTATAALGTVRALVDSAEVDLVGVAAAHRRPPAAPFVSPIPVRHLGLSRPALYESWHRLRRPSVQRAVGPVDAIWVSGMAMPPPSAPLVVTVHDLAFIDHPERATRRGLRFFHRAVELAARDASIVTCPSETTARACRSYGFDPQRLRVVPWGHLAPSVSQEEIDAVRARYALPERFVLWVGTVEPRKNLPVLLDAWRRVRRTLADTELVLVGPPGWGEQVGAAPGEQPEGVQLTGFVSPGALGALYRAATVFVLPSVAEGFGLPVLEALAQGTPVVTSKGTATAEILGDDERIGAAVDPTDADAIADALVAFLCDPERVDSARLPAIARAQTYSPQRCAQGMLAAVRDARLSPR